MSDRKRGKSAKTKESAAAAGKSRGRKGRRGGSSEAAPDGGPGVLSIAAHPRAGASVRQLKAAVGLLAFALAFGLSLHAGVMLAMAAERALMAGVLGYLLAWACAVSVWRAVLVAELRARADELKTRRELAAATSGAAKASPRAQKLGSR